MLKGTWRSMGITGGCKRSLIRYALSGEMVCIRSALPTSKGLFLKPALEVFGGDEVLILDVKRAKGQDGALHLSLRVVQHRVSNVGDGGLVEPAQAPREFVLANRLLMHKNKTRFSELGLLNALLRTNRSLSTQSASSCGLSSPRVEIYVDLDIFAFVMPFLPLDMISDTFTSLTPADDGALTTKLH
ncbi:hypothetical protein AAMO2058_001665200 [Amorphochlora amoebiformis]